MRTHEIDPALLLEGVASWEALPEGARAAWVRLRPSEPVRAASLGRAAETLVDHGLLAVSPSGKLMVPEAARPAHLAVRAASRCRVLGAAPGERQPIVRWIQESYAVEERRALVAEPMHHGDDGAWHLARRVASRAWVAEVLDAGDPDWEARRLELPWGMGRHWKPLLDPASRADLATVVSTLQDAGGALPLLELFANMEEGALDRRARAVQAGLRYLVLFPRLGKDHARLELGLTANAATGAFAPAPPAPHVEAADVEATPAFWITDMATVLLDAAAGEMRIKANGRELYARTSDRLCEALPPLPAWLEAWARADPRRRVNEAIWLLQTLHFLEQGEDERGRRLFRPAEKGRAWLARPLEERLVHVADFVIGRDETDGESASWSRSRRVAYRLAPAGYDALRSVEHLEDAPLVQALRDALATLPTEGAVSLHEWLEHRALGENPLLGTGPLATELDHAARWSEVLPEEREVAWRDFLAAALLRRFLPLGALAVAPHPERDGDAYVALTELGRYLSGQTDAPPAPSDAPGPSRVIVQPNFDVVFLDPAPDVEVDLAALADRVGHRVGTVFHLSRDAAIRAAGAGITTEEARRRLEHAQGGPLPENVARSLEDWFGRVRHVTGAFLTVLRCPDEETASRVERALGAQAERLGPTIVGTGDEKAARKAAARLRAQGIFVLLS